MDSKNLKEEGIYDGKFPVKRRPGRPRKLQPHNLAEEMVNSSDDLPEFFKIYMPDLCSTKLRIPSDFIEKFGGNIPTTCKLQRARGYSWKVDVNRMNDHWFLQKGWPRFVEQNSIKNRDFLTFCYVGKSVFLVKIFSPNGCMKGAGCTSKSDDETSESEDMEEEIHESKRGRASRCRASSIAEEENNESKRGKVSRWVSSVGEIDGKPYFSIVMKKSSFFDGGGRMCVPLEFWNAHLKENTTSKMATLWVGNDSWSVELMIRTGRIRFHSCNKFLSDNSLKIGSLCTFQLIDSNDLSFKVSFGRESRSVGRR